MLSAIPLVEAALPAQTVPPMYRQVASEYGIPPRTLYALAHRQNATELDTGVREAWPWTLGTEGKRTVYRTRLAAHKALRGQLRHGNVVHVGLMQLDWATHAESFRDPWSALDPAYNLRTAAHSLRRHFLETRNWAKACARFAPQPNSTGSKSIARPAKRTSQMVSALNPSSSASSTSNTTASSEPTEDTLPYPINQIGHRRFAEAVRAVAARHGIDPPLLDAVIATESNFDPDAVSTAGAQGLMQLMPATAERFDVTNAFDPRANIDGGARYLRWLIDEFDDLSLALAGYNAGENAVIRHGRVIPPYPETQRYVPRVLAFYAYFKRREPS